MGMRIHKCFTGIILLMGVAVCSFAQDQSKTQLRIETTPPGATIKCDGVLCDPSPTVLENLPPGEHLIAAVLDGHKPAHATVRLVAGQRTGLTLVLEPITGLMLFHSQPEGADVKIEGALRGRTPLLVYDLPVGRYRANFSKDGFQSVDIDIIVRDRAPVKHSVTLKSDSASLSIRSTPPGAVVTVNGAAYGNTPCSVERVPAGDCVIELSLDGCEPYKQNVKLSAGQNEQINAVLKEIPGSMEIVSIPEKARIYVNNEFKGESPVMLKPLPPGNYRIRAELRGHAPMARDITLERAANRTAEFRLQRNCGMLEITTEPAGVQVFIDGENMGTTKNKIDGTDQISQPLTIDLIPIGAHRLQLSKSGFESKNAELTVEKDKTNILHEKLKKIFIVDHRVRTRAATYEGMYLGMEDDGSIRLEIKPGIAKTIPISDIISQGPIKDE